MSDAYSLLVAFGSILTAPFSWLPLELQGVISAAFGVLLGWVLVSISIKIIGLFF